MASRLLGPHSTSLHDDIAAYTFHFLDQKDRDQLSMVSHRNRVFIKDKYPKYNKEVPKYRELTGLQKLELEFIKFQDRPAWQRVGIVALCIFTSPVILGYHSPKILKAVYISIIQPCAKVIGRAIEALAIRINRYLLNPLARVIKRVAEVVFIQIPQLIYRSLLLPIARGVWHVLTQANEYILSPLARAIRSVIVPIGLKIIREVLIPVADAVSTVARGLFITFPLKVWDHILAPVLEWSLDYLIVPVVGLIEDVILFLFKDIVFPVAKVLKVVLKGICITFPSRIYAHILAPIGRTIGRVFNFAYEVVLTPVGQAIQRVASVIFNTVVVPLSNGIKFGAVVLYENVLAPLSALIVSLPSILDHLLSRKIS